MREPGGIVQSSWLDLPLLIEGQLLSQEQDFRAQGSARAEQETEEKKSVGDQIGDQVKRRIQRALGARKESKHGLSGWHRGSPVEKNFLPAGLVSWVP